MASLLPKPGAGKVNGLQRSPRFRARPVRVYRKAPMPLVAAGAGLYAVALSFPLLLQQVDPVVFLLAIFGTGLLLLGLHVRWNRGNPHGQ